jgi:hypothetical protein
MESQSTPKKNTLQFIGTLALIALPFTCMLIALSPLITPRLVEKRVCPQGTHLKTGWHQSTWNKPGEYKLSGECLDTQGQIAPRLPGSNKIGVVEFLIYYTTCFVAIVLVVELFLWLNTRSSAKRLK